jgi:5-methylcytosine-specific restriction endonuclease McrA
LPRGKRLPQWPIKPGDPDWPTCKCGCKTPVNAWAKGNAEKGILKGQPYEYARGHHGRMSERDGEKKRCNKCGEMKLLSDFDRRGPGKPLKHECRECTRQTHKEWRDTNRESWLAQQKEYRDANKELVLERINRWREQNPEASRALGRRSRSTYRARKLNQFVQAVDPLIVLERDDGICGICGHDVDPFDYDVDHIIPLSRGGMHAYSNVQVAHPWCNMSKGSKLEHEM